MKNVNTKGRFKYLLVAILVLLCVTIVSIILCSPKENNVSDKQKDNISSDKTPSNNSKPSSYEDSSNDSQSQKDQTELYKSWYTENVSAKGTPVSSVTALKERLPHFFNLEAKDGLTVHIWQTAENNYLCYLLNSSTNAITDNSFAYKSGTTISEMHAVLSTYNIKKDNITVTPIINPLSSYTYKIDTKYIEKVENLFWQDVNTMYTTISSVKIINHEELRNRSLNSDKLGSKKPPYHVPVYKIDTLKELEDFKNSLNNKSVADSTIRDDISVFTQATANFDKEFFDKNSLVIAYVTTGPGSRPYDIHSIEYNKDSFKIHLIDTYLPGMMVDQVLYEFFITTVVPDEIIKDCTDFDADIDNVNETPNINELKQRFPEYFSLDTSKGLDVYFWNTTREQVFGGLLPTKNGDYTQKELEALSESSATIDEIRAIVGYHLSKGKITKDKITVKLIAMPHTEYKDLSEGTRKYFEYLLWDEIKY